MLLEKLVPDETLAQLQRKTITYISSSKERSRGMMMFNFTLCYSQNSSSSVSKTNFFEWEKIFGILAISIILSFTKNCFNVI